MPNLCFGISISFRVEVRPTFRFPQGDQNRSEIRSLVLPRIEMLIALWLNFSGERSKCFPSSRNWPSFRNLSLPCHAMPFPTNIFFSFFAVSVLHYLSVFRFVHLFVMVCVFHHFFSFSVCFRLSRSIFPFFNFNFPRPFLIWFLGPCWLIAMSALWNRVYSRHQSPSTLGHLSRETIWVSILSKDVFPGIRVECAHVQLS